LIGPLLRYLDALQRQDPDRRLLVVLSEVVPKHWWDNLLHNQTALRLKLRLFFRPNTIVADVPYHAADV
jgi:16S rRNA A1518/A1519 N6-dimethyltransferase RsmA/KsgA/DIM1 with predicted DNA glycosylase/AP lyase activity